MSNQIRKQLAEEGVHIVRFTVGLGNQFFQYALYRTFLEMGFPTYGDTTALKPDQSAGGNQLSLFGIFIDEAPGDYVKELFAGDSRIERALVRRIGKTGYYKKRDIDYHEEIMHVPYGYFDGYWQSCRYFEAYADEIRKSIVTSEDVFKDHISIEYAGLIQAKKNSVAIHVRLGDYLKKSKLYGGICTTNYYIKALEYMKSVLSVNGEGPAFFVFSNNPELAKKELPLKEAIFVNGHTEDQGYLDLMLMSMCDHFIIANSSFSWWGAYLGKNQHKMIIAPSRWLNGAVCPDIIPKGWVRL